jgi:tetratricopeptide (TPR) repeat protein
LTAAFGRAMRDDVPMPLSLDEIHDLIDSWEFDPRVDTLAPASQLLATMAPGDPGRIDVLQVIADHHAMRGEVNAALATLDRAGTTSDEEADVVQAMRVAFLIEAGRGDEAEAQLQELRRRGPRLPAEALERVAETLEDAGRLQEAMRWFTIGLRDLDPRHDLPEPHEEDALLGRWRVRKALDLPPDHFDDLARITLDLRRTT